MESLMIHEYEKMFKLSIRIKEYGKGGQRNLSDHFEAYFHV